MPWIPRILVLAWGLVWVPITAHGEPWTSPHISIAKLSSWSDFLDVLNQPHLDVTIHNDGNAAVGTVDFQCSLFILDRATPVFEGSWSTTLDRVIRPGKDQNLKLEPNMFSDLGQVIEHGYRNAAWSCYVSRVLTAEGQSVAFDPGAIQHKGPTLGIGYVPVPQTMVGPLKLPGTDGMWVLKIQPGSLAESLGIRAGDVIASVDGRPLRAMVDLTSDFDEAVTKGRPADFMVIRAGAQIHVSIPTAGVTDNAARPAGGGN